MVAGLHVALSARYRVQPSWVVPVVLAVLLAVLVAAGGVIWVTNVIAFELWYWDLDRGGAAARAHRPGRNSAFVFPEMQHAGYEAAGSIALAALVIARAVNILK